MQIETYTSIHAPLFLLTWEHAVQLTVPHLAFPLHCVSKVMSSLPVLMFYSVSLCGCATVGLHCFLSFIITNKTAVDLRVLCDHM